MSESIADILAQRRAQLANKRAKEMTIPVPGYEDVLACRYRQLPAEEKLDIVHRHEGVGSDGANEIAAAADVLINACIELVKVTGKDDAGELQYEGLGYRWTADGVVALFKVELPENATARQAIRAVLDGEDILTHLSDYHFARIKILNEGDELVQGESEPSVEG